MKTLKIILQYIILAIIIDLHSLLRWGTFFSDSVSTGFSCVSTTVWLHYMDLNEAYGENSQW